MLPSDRSHCCPHPHDEGVYGWEKRVGGWILSSRGGARHEHCGGGLIEEKVREKCEREKRGVEMDERSEQLRRGKEKGIKIDRVAAAVATAAISTA